MTKKKKVKCIKLLTLVALADATFNMKKMLQDGVATHITGFFSDSKTVLEDFKSFKELFRLDHWELKENYRRREGTAPFVYRFEAPGYQLKQNHALPLPGIVDLEMIKTSGDCNGAYVTGQDGVRLDGDGRIQ